MSFQKSNLIHATTLTIISLWMYYDALNKDFGLLIPFLFGVVLLSLNQGVMYENTAQKNAAFGITILSAVFIFLRIFGMLRDDTLDGLFWYVFMGFTSFLSVIVFIWIGFRSKFTKSNK
jgi:hypothetical protein